MEVYPRVILRIEFGPGMRLGPGKARLLELVRETGSISAAARQMEMSYRRAWLLIEEANGLFGAALVETSAGGAGGGGATLTPLGAAVIEAFRKIEAETAKAVARGLGTLPGKPLSRSPASARRSTRS